MNNSQKEQVQKELSTFVDRYPSQKKAAAMLRGVSESIIINIKKGNWESISDEMWRKVAKQIGHSSGSKWKITETKPTNHMKAFFEDARRFQNTFAMVSPAGTGKTSAAKQYALENDNVFHLNCSEYLNRKAFLTKLLESMGLSISGNVSFMMDTIVDEIHSLKDPLIILDEADKLSDQVLYFFITLYNRLEGKCGIILMSTDFLSTRINKGRKLNKKGYNEIFSRIGRRFITIGEMSATDVARVCEENGVHDPETIQMIQNSYEGDLRRVEREVHKYKRIQETKTAA
jgi:hypothetical protein